MKNTITIKDETAIIIINTWWDRWHRFAEEDDVPPDHIQRLINKLAEHNKFFNHQTGLWEKE